MADRPFAMMAPAHLEKFEPREYKKAPRRTKGDRNEKGWGTTAQPTGTILPIRTARQP